jgi:hypothetical protein
VRAAAGRAIVAGFDGQLSGFCEILLTITVRLATFCQVRQKPRPSFAEG